MLVFRLNWINVAFLLFLLPACATDQPIGEEPANPPVAYDQPGERVTARSGNLSPEAEAVFAAMEGSWISEADPKEEVVFGPDRYTTFYNGRQVIQEDLTLHASCPVACSAGGEAYNGPCFIVAGEFDATCYAIVRADRTTLEISLLGGPGTLLRYRRK